MPEKPLRYRQTALVLALVLAFIGALIYGFGKIDYTWDFKTVLTFFWNAETKSPGLILQGIIGTLRISLVSITAGSILGLVVGTLLRSKEKIPAWMALVYVDVFRNTPVLVQLYIVYFVFGSFLDFSAETAGTITLSLFCAAYVGDIFRGTLDNFDRGQIDAAKSLGMSQVQIARHIIAPQALRRMLPPLVGQFVTLVKDSSLVSVLGILDLTKSALQIISMTFRGFETWFLIAALYLGVNLVLSTFGRYLETRLGAELR